MLFFLMQRKKQKWLSIETAMARNVLYIKYLYDIYFFKSRDIKRKNINFLCI